jgi:hypothetical protein
MSHTNHTQYYGLPQYVGSDIINPLTDTNGAYETIDTTMHNIAEEAGQGTTNIATLQTKVGSGVFQTTAQNATDAVNELVGELDTADTGIKARLATAESDIDTLQSQMVTAQGNIVDLQNNKANASDVSVLQTTVGDANSGLVKDVDNLNTVVDGAITYNPATGLTIDTVFTERSIASKVGKVAFVNLFGNITVDASDTQYSIGLLPFRPHINANSVLTQTGFICDQYNAPTSIEYTLSVFPSGELRIETSAPISSVGDSVLSASITFVTND